MEFASGTSIRHTSLPAMTLAEIHLHRQEQAMAADELEQSRDRQLKSQFRTRAALFTLPFVREWLGQSVHCSPA